MKAAWIAPFILALVVTPALAVDTDNNVQQQSQTQGNVSPNAINPGQGKQPDGYSDGGENQQHTDDFGASQVTDPEGDTDLEADTDGGSDANADSDTRPDTGTDTDDGASTDSGGSENSGGSSDSDD
ncbi:MSCRAMM family adhesin SdrC [Kushneria sp. AK178]